jgi:GT2 family glycosyltransferase
VDAFKALIADQKVDVVYANTIVLLEPLIAARETGCSTIIHVRELIDRDEGLVAQLGLEYDAIIRKVESLADGIVANSRETERLFGNHANRFCVPNVVSPQDLDIPNPVGGTIKFIMASSNIPKKGLDDFIEVARRCEETVPLAEFILVGPENTHTKALRDGSHPGNIVFAGYAESPKCAMEQGNVVLSLSHFAESFGRTVAEGQTARRPVIAYDWGAVAELIVHGETGFLAPYRDIEAVCGYIKTICENPGTISTLGEAGRASMLAGFTQPVLVDGLWRALEATAQMPIGLREARQEVTIVVPVYNAFEATKVCLESLEAQTEHAIGIRILMINDASTDPRITPLLETFAKLPTFHLLTNAFNKGYTHTINIGINWAQYDDIVLLNSDAVVTRGWLKGLSLAAYSGVNVATATAMSDNAGAFSFPVQNSPNPKPEGVSYDDFADLIIAHTAKLLPVSVPTGSGFCMYIRRDALNVIGLFDEEAFPRGYGEENDFCMRAIKAGLRNVISPYSYVFHVRSASFGKEKDTLIKGAVDTVTTRYPEYARLVKESFGSAEMKALRQASHDATAQL